MMGSQFCVAAVQTVVSMGGPVFAAVDGPVAAGADQIELAGTDVGGLLGGLVAVPVYVTVRTLFLDYRKYRSGKVRTRNGA